MRIGNWVIGLVVCVSFLFASGGAGHADCSECHKEPLVSLGTRPDKPCRVGVQMHLPPGKGADGEFNAVRHARMFVESDMADYALLVQGLPTEELDAVVKYLTDHRVPFLLQELFPTGPDWFNEPKPKRRFGQEDYDRIRAIAGPCFLGVHWGELDSSGMKPEDYLPADVLEHPTRRAVKEAFAARVRERLDMFRQHYNVPFAHSSALLYHALFGETGVDMLCSEIGENIPNVNMMIASNRGAARAYGRPWMIDHSTWWSPRGNVGEQVSPREGHTPWCLFTTLLEAVMGGADYVQLEVDWAAYDKEYNLLPWGVALKNLVRLARTIGPRGETETPYAILLGHENGWPGVGWRVGDVRGTGLYDGIRHQFMQTRDADLSLKLLEEFYPGFERCAWDPEYPGFLAESPYGPLDFVPDNLAPEKYARYRVLWALGYHRMTPELLESMRAYVEKGGTLVCADNLFLDERERPVKKALRDSLIGCEADMRDWTLIHLYQPKGRFCDERFGAIKSEEWQDHWLHPVRLTTGKVVARLNETPYIVENRIGKGTVFFVTGLNMVGGSSTRRCQEPFLYSNLLSELVDLYRSDVKVAPWNGIDHVLNKRPDGSALLLLMNHGDMECRRDVTLSGMGELSEVSVVAQGSWKEWHEGAAVELVADRKTWSIELPAKSFVIFECRK